MGFSESGEFADVLSFGYVSLSLSVSTTAIEAKVGASRLEGRQELLLYNDSLVTVYMGPATVTTSGTTKGIPLLPGEFLQVPFGNVPVYLIAESGTNSVIVQELA